jgi:ketosteroid isomerase-like protein
VSDPRETLLREGIAAYNRGDTEAVLAALDPEIEVYAPPEVVNAGTFHGHEGYLTWVESWIEAWEEFRIEPVEIEQFGDDFVVHMDARGRGKGSGAEVSLRFWWVYTVPADRATRLHLYLDRETALKALRA